MQQDFNYLRKTLEDVHPGLYMHQPREAMQRTMDSLYGLLNKPLHFFDYYKIIAYLLASVKCEHTIFNPYPGSIYSKQQAQWKVLPFQLYFLDNKAYVAVNRTTDASIHVGYEVLSINGHAADSVKRELFRYMQADANMESSKREELSSLNFNQLYYLFIERPDAYDVLFKTPDGRLVQKKYTQDLTSKASNDHAIKNPVNRQVFASSQARGKKDEEAPYRLELLPERFAAVLTIRTFMGEHEKILKLYKQFFDTLQQQHIRHLIIDLSYNGGGNHEMAAELLSYLVKTPVRFIESEHVITVNPAYFRLSNLPVEVKDNKDKYLKPEKDGRFYVKEETQPELALFRPKPNRFRGDLYFYVNGMTASAASTFAAVAQSNRLGVIVGEETAGCYSGGGSTNAVALTLPYSNIPVSLSMVYFQFATSGRDKDRGVIPDHPFHPSFNDLVAGAESWKDYILRLIPRTLSTTDSRTGQ